MSVAEKDNQTLWLAKQPWEVDQQKRERIERLAEEADATLVDVLRAMIDSVSDADVLARLNGEEPPSRRDPSPSIDAALQRGIQKLDSPE